jgi:hypothetical protein
MNVMEQVEKEEKNVENVMEQDKLPILNKACFE